jgi:hypothetical protein
LVFKRIGRTIYTASNRAQKPSSLTIPKTIVQPIRENARAAVRL